MSEAMIIDVNAENFQQMVLENSQHVPVLVDFWAPWCGPCKQVMPTLEKLAQEWAGRFILAKINTEEQQELADQFQIRGIPHFKIIHQGQVVKELQGALPVGDFKAALEPYLKADESEDLRQAAKAAFSEGEFDQAVALLGQAAQANPNNYKVHLDLVQMYLHTGHMEQAEALLNKLPEEAQNSKEGKSLKNLMHFAKVVEEAGSIKGIQQAIETNPNDPAALYGLSGYLMLHGDVEKAMQSLLKLFMVDKTYQEGIARTTLLQIFELLQEEQPQLVNAYRRKLQNLMF